MTFRPACLGCGQPQPDAQFGHKREIRSRIPANNCRETATSVRWNTTYLACLTTFAPILTNFSRSVVSVQPWIDLGLRVFAIKGLLALSAGGRLHRDGLLNLLRRHQGPLLAGVARLPAPSATGRGLRRPGFDVGRVAGRWAGGVGGVLVEALPQVIDLLLEGLQPLLILLDEGQDSRVSGRRNLAPESNRDRRNRRHINILRPPKARASSGRERLPCLAPPG
jgi:hypothetical protein